MLEFDKALKQFCDDVGGIYRRYSDDILLVCAETHAVEAESMVVSMLSNLRLEISKDKTEITRFDVTTDAPLSERAAQYLGFNLYPDGPGIRPSSLSRQWRKMRRSLRRTAKVAAAAISKGLPPRSTPSVYDGASHRSRSETSHLMLVEVREFSVVMKR